MTTCRDVIAAALAALGAIAPGGEATADELDAGLAAITGVALDLHNARGPLTEVDVGADYLAGENQRVRVEAGATVAITLPNSVQIVTERDPFDYGFALAPMVAPSGGSAGPADGLQSRTPRDGARVEIVGVTQALFFYRADINAWVIADPLLIDGQSPFNGRYDSALSALVAERLVDAMNIEPSANLLKRIARGNAALMIQSATARDRLRPEYF